MSRLLLLLLMVLPQSPLSSEVVDKVIQRYSRLNDLSADFEHILQDSSNQPAHYRGHVYLKSGKRARFDYVSPVKKSEYFDPKTYTVFNPEAAQAIQDPIGKADSDRLAILQIVGNREAAEWKKQFKQTETPAPSYKPLKPGSLVVRLTPHNKDLKDVLIEVDPKSFLIERLVFTYVDGERNEFRFTDIQTKRLEDSIFKFIPPPGVQIKKG
jgi:outer membrane lipoprotein-sorting protein